MCVCVCVLVLLFEGPCLVLSLSDRSGLCVCFSLCERPSSDFSLVQLGFCYLWCRFFSSVCVRLILHVFSQTMLSYTSDYGGASLHSWWQRLPAQNSQSPTCQITHRLAEQICSDLYSYQMMMMMVIILKALRY